MSTSKLGPWELDLVSVDGSIAHALAVTEYPFQDGADIEDMGTDPEKYSFECVINGAKFDQEYEAIRDWFLKRFSKPVELFHPDFGTLHGYPGTASFKRNNRKRFASFSFDFTVSGLRPEAQAYLDVKRAADVSVAAINGQVAEKIAEEMQKQGVPDVEGSDWSLLDKWGAMGAVARSFALGCQSTMGKIGGVLSQIEAPADAISAVIDYTSTLSGTLTKQLQECAEAYTTLARKVDPRNSNENTRSSSKSVIAALITDLITSKAVVADSPPVVRDGYTTIACATVSREAARLVAQDEASLSASIAAEKIQLEDGDGRLLAEPQPVYLLTPAELEDMLALVRAMIQENLGTSLAPDSIKKMAADLMESVRSVKLQYMTTSTVSLTNPMPLHVLCASKGLDYKAADRVAALNGVKNPTFMEGEVLIYAS